MSTESPPTYTTSIFNQANFNTSAGGLDTAYLNAHYLRYPVAQTGTETIANLATTNDATINGLTVGKGSASSSTNIAVGVNALKSNTTGNKSLAIGYEALYNSLGSTDNVGIGYFSLHEITNGHTNNVGVGNFALQATAASNNTGIGYQAGYNNTFGSNNTYVGYQAAPSGSNFSKSTALGSGATITASNQVVLGTTTETVVIPNQIQVSYSSIPTFTSTSIGYTASFSLATLAFGTGIRSTANTSIALPIGVYMCHIYYQINITFPGTTRNIIEFNITSGATLTTRAIMGLVYAPAIQEYNYYSIPAILKITSNPCSVYSELTANGGNCSINSASLAVVRIA